MTKIKKNQNQINSCSSLNCCKKSHTKFHRIFVHAHEAMAERRAPPKPGPAQRRPHLFSISDTTTAGAHSYVHGAADPPPILSSHARCSGAEVLRRRRRRTPAGSLTTATRMPRRPQGHQQQTAAQSADWSGYRLMLSPGLSPPAREILAVSNGNEVFGEREGERIILVSEKVFVFNGDLMKIKPNLIEITILIWFQDNFGCLEKYFGSNFGDKKTGFHNRNQIRKLIFFFKKKHVIYEFL